RRRTPSWKDWSFRPLCAPLPVPLTACQRPAVPSTPLHEPGFAGRVARGGGPGEAAQEVPEMDGKRTTAGCAQTRWAMPGVALTPLRPPVTPPQRPAPEAIPFLAKQMPSPFSVGKRSGITRMLTHIEHNMVGKVDAGAGCEQ